jgi:hypothetical protein
MSGYGTNRTNRADLMMSVPRGNPEVAFAAVRNVFDPMQTLVPAPLLTKIRPLHIFRLVDTTRRLQ